MADTTTAVLKFGGEVVADAEGLAAVLGDVAVLARRGWRFVLCHGGGPQASDLQDRLGLPTLKVGGRRVTDPATLQVVKQVLAGEVSVDVVAAAAAAGLSAVGISGVSAWTITASRRPPTLVSGEGDTPVDFGLVGQVDEVRPELLRLLLDAGHTPVLNSLGIEPAADGELTSVVYNINADTVAAAVGAALKADHLFLMTGVPGVLQDKDNPATRIPSLTRAAAQAAIDAGTIVGGMIPKIEEAFRNISAGIGAVHILGAVPGALAGEASRPGSVGTVLIEGA